MTSFAALFLLLANPVGDAQPTATDPRMLFAELVAEIGQGEPATVDAMFINVQKCNALLDSKGIDFAELADGWKVRFHDAEGTIFTTLGFFILHIVDAKAGVTMCMVTGRVGEDADSVAKKFAGQLGVTPRFIGSIKDKTVNPRWSIEAKGQIYLVNDAIQPPAGVGIVVGKPNRK